MACEDEIGLLWTTLSSKHPAVEREYNEWFIRHEKTHTGWFTFAGLSFQLPVGLEP